MSERLSRVDKYKHNRERRNKRVEEVMAGSTAVSLEPERLDLSAFNESADSDGSDVQHRPTRKELFPSQRLKVTKWFYNSLLYGFVIIMIILLWWGISESPWGKSQGL